MNFSRTNPEDEIEKIFTLATDIPESTTYYTNEEMLLIDQRYQAEKALLKAIEKGDQKEAANALISYAHLMQSPSQKAFPTSTDSLRDFKNSILTMNTLFRKAVENSMVHPIYINEYSTRFSVKIELATNTPDLTAIIIEMIKKYCSLVRNYSLATYSKTVRDAILYIHLHLCAPLSTRDISKAQNLSPNYLSNQFKTEVGSTITSYIQKNRIEMALKYLNTTEFSIAEIAFRIGIADVSYFSKQFKKQIGMSPLQYQKMMQQEH